MTMNIESMLVTIMSKAAEMVRLPNTPRRSRMTLAIPIIRAMITIGIMNLIIVSTIFVKYFTEPCLFSGSSDTREEVLIVKGYLKRMKNCPDKTD
jgi:hypothetical protein